MSESPDRHERLSSVRRRLFQDEAPDGRAAAVLEEAHQDNVQNRLLEEIRQSRETARQKWNFDFETETPLEGDWEWCPARNGEAAAAPEAGSEGRSVQQNRTQDQRDKTV